MEQYEVVTTDWNYEQTKVWRYHVEKHCPGATIITTPDTKPYPWCRLAGKLGSFDAQFDTDRVIYIDTDTIVTRDLAFLFDAMGDCVLAASSAIPVPPFSCGSGMGRRWYAALWDDFSFNFVPVHFNSGLLVLKGYDPGRLGQGIRRFFDHKKWRKAVRGYDLVDEAALAYWLATDLQYDQIHHIPLEHHGNITRGRAYFGDCAVPAVVHYHKPERLKGPGLYHLYEEGMCHEV